MFRAADTIYRLCLLALPGEIRREFGDDMVQMFRDYRKSERGRPLRLLGLWIAAIADILTTRLVVPHPVSSGAFMRSLMFDARHSVRLLRRYPAMSLLALATLALGIGANTAIFSVIDSVLLRALPYPEADRVVMVFEKRPKESPLPGPVSPADFLDWRTRNAAFDSMAAYTPASITVTGVGEPQQIMAGLASPSFFDILGIRPEAGRLFTASDETGAQQAIVLTNGFWRRFYGADPKVVGRSIDINGAPFRIIGVLPSRFAFIDDTIQIWVPLSFKPDPSRVSHGYDVYAHLKSGVTIAQASDDMQRIGLDLEKQYPDANAGHYPQVITLRDRYNKDVKTSLIILFAAVGFVLLIACVNVANLLLTRAVSRGREMAVRAALGAGRGRLVGQSLMESLTLATIGGVAGVGLAVLMLQALPAIMPERLALVGLDDLHLDLRILGFALFLSLVTGGIFGALPAIYSSRPNLNDTLKSGGRGGTHIKRGARIGLVIGEVALASLTLFGAGLVVRSFDTMRSQPLGFDTANALSFSVGLPGRKYKTPELRQVTLEDIERRLTAMPGVASVGAIDFLPLSGENSRRGVGIEGREVKPGEPPTRMHPRVVTPTYFRTMGIAILQGRAFSAEDATKAMPVVIVNETAVRTFWPSGNPIGTRVQFSDSVWRTVVGVARDVRHWGFDQDVNPMIYVPQAQMQSSYLTFVVKSTNDPGALTNGARAAVAAIDPNLPLSKVRTLDDLASESLRAERAQSVLMLSFGALALLLAVIGIYGVTSQLVNARVHDIGVRLTLGARPGNILTNLLTEGVWQTAAGLVIGVGAGLLLLRIGSLHDSLLYRIQPWDPIALAVVVIAVAAATIAAGFVPWRRAMKVDPVQALRS